MSTKEPNLVPSSLHKIICQKKWNFTKMRTLLPRSACGADRPSLPLPHTPPACRFPPNPEPFCSAPEQVLITYNFSFWSSCMFLLRLTSSDQTASFSFTSLTSNVRVAPPNNQQLEDQSEDATYQSFDLANWGFFLLIDLGSSLQPQNHHRQDEEAPPFSNVLQDTWMISNNCEYDVDSTQLI